MSVRQSYCAWKVYVFGADVTDRVSSVTANWNDARTPNISQIVLANERDELIITESDIHAMYDDIDLTELNDSGPAFERQVKKRLRVGQGAILDDLKRRVLEAKVLERVDAVDQPGLDHGVEFQRTVTAEAVQKSLDSGKLNAREFVELHGQVLRFPFQVGHPIFHAGDAVTVFFRNPLDPDEWFFEARGYVSDFDETADANGRRTLTLSCEDNLRPFRHARVSTNASISDVKAVADPRYDELVRTWFKDNFVNMTIAEIVMFMAFGSDGVSKAQGRGLQFRGTKRFDQNYYGVQGKTGQDVPVVGAGIYNINSSKIFELGPKQAIPELGLSASDVSKVASAGSPIKVESISSLETWQKAIDHVVPTSIDDILAMCLPERSEEARADLLALSEDGASVTVQEAMDIIGRNPHMFPVERGRIMVLVPSTLGPGTNTSIMLRDLVAGVASQTEFISRLQIIYNVCQRIDFSFYATPRGDVICEMPLYSFQPKDFGRYESRYTFQSEDICGWSSQFSDDKVRTVFSCSPYTIANMQATGQLKQLWLQPGTVFLRALTPMFGLRVETADPFGAITSNEAAAYYGFLKLSQMNSNAWMQRMQTIMHLGMGPNRPCYFQARDFIASVRGATDSIVWGMGGQVTQNLTLNYRRGWSGLTNDFGKVYEPFGGRMSNPIDYPLLFQERTARTETSTKSDENSAPTITTDDKRAQQTKAIRDFAKASKDRLEELGMKATLTSIDRPDPRTNESLKAKLRLKAADGIQEAQEDLALFDRGIDPHFDLRSFDISAGQGKAPTAALAAKLNQMKDEGFFPKGTKIHPEPGLNHVHVQLPHAINSANKTEWGEGE